MQVLLYYKQIAGGAWNDVPLDSVTDVTDSVLASATVTDTGSVINYAGATASISGLTNGGRYWFWVEIIDDSGNSSGIQSLNKHVALSPVAVDAQPGTDASSEITFTNLAAAVAGVPVATIFLMWNTVDNSSTATELEIDESSLDGSGGYTVTGFQPSTLYYLWVRIQSQSGMTFGPAAILTISVTTTSATIAATPGVTIIATPGLQENPPQGIYSSLLESLPDFLNGVPVTVGINKEITQGGVTLTFTLPVIVYRIKMTGWSPSDEENLYTLIERRSDILNTATDVYYRILPAGESTISTYSHILFFVYSYTKVNAETYGLNAAGDAVVLM